MSDPRFTDPRLSDPVGHRDDTLGGPWTWIAGIVVIAFIAFVVIASVNHNRNTASNNPSPVTTGSAPRNISPPSTTGSGSSSPQPLTPAPNQSGTQ
jgi:hypothetical protein